MLSQEASAEPGQWDTSKAEYGRAIMDSVSDPYNETTTAMCGSQLGKTEWELNTIGYFSDQDPSSIMYITADLNLAESFSKLRLGPMFRDTPCLRGKIRDGRTDGRRKGSMDTLLEKMIPGGVLVLAGANSPASLSSRPIRVIMGDEIDRWSRSIGRKESQEGDPIGIAQKRAGTFRQIGRAHV